VATVHPRLSSTRPVLTDVLQRHTFVEVNGATHQQLCCRVAFAKRGATPVWEGSAFASRACVHRSSLAQVKNQLDAFFIILIWHKLVCK
jgi:hypothetical protein